MSPFEHFWTLLSSHGVIPSKRRAAEEVWDTFNLQQQREIYRAVRDKINAKKFVNYDPVIAIMNNAPKLVREPTNYNRRALPDEPVCIAKWKGSWGTYTVREAQEYGMEIKAG